MDGEQNLSVQTETESESVHQTAEVHATETEEQEKG